jgi:hypothetical protein
MLPTESDIAVQLEIRKAQIQEAADWRMMRQLIESNKESISTFSSFLVHLGNWMVKTGHQLRSRYGNVPSVDAKMRSLEQGC